MIKDFAGVPLLWMIGVMDGHGVNGHHVSQYVKRELPLILTNLMEGKTPEQATITS
jgi:hypothetical protein